MCKIALAVVFASVVNCRGWQASNGILHARPSASKDFGTQQSREVAALRTLLLAPKGARSAHAGHRPRFPAARMLVQPEEPARATPEEPARATDPKMQVETELTSKEENEEFISDELQQNINEATYLLMRLAVGAVMIHHGQEKILSAEMFTKFAIDKYFSFLPGPHIYWTYLVGYIQYLAPFLMGLGVFSRAAGASLFGVMAGALAQSVIQNGWEKFPMFELAGLSQKLKYGVPIFHNYGFEVPLLYVAVFGLVAIKGPGKFSIAQLLGWNDDNSLLGKLKQ